MYIHYRETFAEYRYYLFNYSSEGAPTGQISAQLPQEMHSSALITYFPSPSVMQLTGQPSAQAPQAMHSSLILNAILDTSINENLSGKSPTNIFYHIILKNQEYF